MDAKTIWEGACRHLEGTLPVDVYERWIAVIRALSHETGVLTLGVSNDFYITWLEENYLPMIRKAVAAECGEELVIRLLVDPEAAPPAAPVRERTPAAEPARRPAIRRRAPEPVLNPKFTFNHFVVGPSNMFAHSSALAVADSPGRAYNPLLIYGGVALGKTHLMQAIGHHVWKKNNSNHVCYVTSEAFLNEYVEALQTKQLGEFRNKYRCADALLIDDIQFFSGKGGLQEEFFHTFNALFHNHKQIVLTCDRPLNEVPLLEPRLVSRFEWGLVTGIEQPDEETRLAILHAKAQQLGVQIPEEYVRFIASHIRSNIRRLEGALISISSYQSLTGRLLSIEDVERLLQHSIDPAATSEPSIESIQKMVAEFFDIRLADMTSKRRPASVALPRQVAMFLSRSLTSHSLPSIGEAFGRNHATVIHACRLVEDRIKTSSQFRLSVSSIRQKLGYDALPRT